MAAAPAQAATTSHLRSSLVHSTVLIGNKAVVTGAVSPYVAGKPVVLQRFTGGAWRTLGHERTSKKGAFSFGVRITGKPGFWTFRVVRGASGGVKAVVGKKLVVRSTKTIYKVSAAAVTKVNAGIPVSFSGAVSPKTTGKVYLQVLRGGKWVTLTSGKLSGSKYTVGMRLPAKTYPLRVIKPYNTSIAQGTSKVIKVTVYPAITASSRLAVSGADEATLGLSGPRLVFSTVKSAATPAKRVTFRNTGSAPVTVSGVGIQGANASSFTLAPGQPTRFVIPAGGSVGVNVLFTPTRATSCPSKAVPYGEADVNRSAGLVFSSSDPVLRGGSALLSGVNSCDYSGSNEPVLDQIMSALGYTDVVTGAKTDRRFIGQTPMIPGTDEVPAPYFRAANPAAPVSITPVAHYSTSETKPYQPLGWFRRGAAIGADGTCNSACRELWRFPAEATGNSFAQNQKLLPQTTASGSFSPGGTVFGLYVDQFTNVNWSNDKFNIAHKCSPSPDNCKDDSVPISPTKYLHDLRTYPVFGPGHVRIPNEYLIAIDVSRLADKNNDFQDIVLLVKNVVPVTQ